VSTRPCPFCGHPVSLDAKFCGQCGNTLSSDVHEEATVARDYSQLVKTMLEERPFGATQKDKPSDPAMSATISDPAQADQLAKDLEANLALAATDPQAAPVANKPVMKTMLLGGSAPIAEPPKPEVKPEPKPEPKPEVSPLSQSVHSPGSAAPLPPGSDKRTMLGMPAASLGPASQPQPSARSQEQQPLKTMLGVAIPGIAPTHEPPPQQPPPQFPSKQGTMLGVAVPGIAPTGQPQPQNPASQNMRVASQPEYYAPPPPPIVPPPPPLFEEPLPDAPALQAKRGVPVIAVIAIVFVVTAVLGGAAAYVALRSGGPLTAQPQLDESGKESLKLGCPTCPDGTTVTLGASSATVASGAAVLPLPAPLSIGDNDLTIKLDRPGARRDEDVKIHVPVAYRVRADLATLSARPPVITVRVEATPGSDVKVDDKPLALDASGRGAYTIDLSHDCDGPSDDTKTFDRKIPFVLTPKGGKQESGELVARTAIVALHIDAPGVVLFTDRPNAPIAGVARPGATVTIDGAPAPVDAQGRFGVRVALPDTGDKVLEIVASAPPLAPRIVHAKVTHVASLDQAAKDWTAQQNPIGYDQFGADPASKAGQKAFVDGEIVEARTGQGHSVLLVEDKKNCAKGQSCLVRVTHGEEVRANHGDKVRAYGRIVGAVQSSGKNVPDFDASLVVTGKK
jgi:hypothetical protein